MKKCKWRETCKGAIKLGCESEGMVVLLNGIFVPLCILRDKEVKYKWRKEK